MWSLLIVKSLIPTDDLLGIITYHARSTFPLTQFTFYHVYSGLKRPNKVKKTIPWDLITRADLSWRPVSSLNASTSSETPSFSDET